MGCVVSTAGAYWLYGLIAVLVVLIPEWLADGTLDLGQAKGCAPNALKSLAHPSQAFGCDDLGQLGKRRRTADVSLRIRNG